jgi:hypothetical protein
MHRHIPSDTPTDIQTTAYIRQNCNKKNDDVIGPVRISKKLHVPYAHTKQDIIDYSNNHNDYVNTNPGRRYIKIASELPNGSIILIPDGKKGLIVRMTSIVKSGIIESLCVASSPRTCGHPVIRDRHHCVTCADSIEEIFNPSDLQKISAHLKSGHLIEPFWSLYRDVEVIGEADYNGIDGRSFAGPDSAGKWSRYWRQVT